jgi:hypothetical protein
LVEVVPQFIPPRLHHQHSIHQLQYQSMFSTTC